MSVSKFNNTMTSKLQNDLLMQMEQMKSKANGKANAINTDEGSNNSKINNFKEILSNYVNNVNSNQINANDLSAKMAMGDKNVSLSQVVPELVKAELEFNLLVQVKNKIVQAYQKIMDMPM